MFISGPITRAQSILYCTIYFTFVVASPVSIHLFSIDLDCYLGFYVVLENIVTASISSRNRAHDLDQASQNNAVL